MIIFLGTFFYIAIFYVCWLIDFRLALGFLLISTFILNQFLPQIKGYIGEQRIRKLLENLGEEYVLINDLYVPKKSGELTQVDHVLLSLYGIFVIETKNYTGWIFGSETQRNWTQTIYNKKSRFYNPIMQNNAHVKALQHYLDLEVPMYSIIVFSNSATFKFKEPFTQAKVIQNRQLKKTVKSYQAAQISPDKLSYIAQLLQSLVITDKEQRKQVKKQHLQHVEDAAKGKHKRKPATKKVEPVIARVEPMTELSAANETADLCPKCNAPLVIRNGKNGTFYGCSLFPKCRFTKRMRVEV